MKKEALELDFEGLIQFHQVDMGQEEVTSVEKAVWESRGIAMSSG